MTNTTQTQQTPNELKVGDIVITSNTYGSLFVYRSNVTGQKFGGFESADFECIATSVVWNRVRNIATAKATPARYEAARNFTERSIRRKGADFVAASLRSIGLTVPKNTSVYLVGPYGSVKPGYAGTV